MITRIAPDIYKGIREADDLGVDEAAAPIRKKRQIIYRIERGEQLLNAEDEAALVKAANLSKDVFCDIVCKALTKFLGRPVIVTPKSGYRPASPLVRGDEMYIANHERLPAEVRERIKAKLHMGRLVDAAADQAADLILIEIREMIEGALGPEAVLDTDLDPDGDD